jgi:hypothetical protein
VLAPLTGYDVARAIGGEAAVIVGTEGDDCAYAWRERVIVLSPEVARGTDMYSLIVAAEEAAHHAQPRWWHWLRFLQPMRWLAEADAFARVKGILGRRARGRVEG